MTAVARLWEIEAGEKKAERMQEVLKEGLSYRQRMLHGRPLTEASFFFLGGGRERKSGNEKKNEQDAAKCVTFCS